MFAFNFWTLKNNGNAVVDVLSINVEVLSIEDNYEYDLDGALKDYSLGSIKLSATKHGEISLSDGIDSIQPLGEISRSISIAFNPANNLNSKWFSSNMVMFEIKALINSPNIEDDIPPSVFSTSLDYECHEPNA